MKVTVLGSCVSRVSLLRGQKTGHGIADGEKYGLELEYFLDKHNIALAMMPPPFSEEEVNTITSSELWDKTRDVSLRQSLMKKREGDWPCRFLTLPVCAIFLKRVKAIDKDSGILYNWHNCFG